MPTADALPYVDRCLGCMACVTACPSGVAYGHLLTPFRAMAERSAIAPADEPRRPHAGQGDAALSGPLSPGRAGGQAGAFAARRAARRTWRHAGPAAGQRCPTRRAAAGDLSGAGTAAGTGGAAGRLRAAGAGAADQLGDAARAGAQRRRDGHPQRAGLLRLALAAHRRGRAGAGAGAQAIWRSFPPMWMPSSPTRPAAARACTSMACSLPASRMHGVPEAFSHQVRDISVFLDELGIDAPPALPDPLTVAYHDACHLAHAQGITRRRAACSA